MSAVLVIEDDDRIRLSLVLALEEEGYAASGAPTAEEGLAAQRAEPADTVLVDLMLPGIDGFECIRQLRRTDDVPILMLTAMGEPKDRIAGLEKGVDDYLAKPFEARELLLRIQNVLRRNKPPAEAGAEPARQVTFGPYQFDLELGELTQKGKRVPLTDAEVGLLRALTARLGEVLSRETLSKSVGAAVNERAIDVQVTRLRRKIEPDPAFPRYLRTVRGQGYRLVDA